MGSFNLGRIRGEKGEKGDTGPKGDTGAKGEKGEKGDNGQDAITPVFKVGSVATLRNGEAALVELDSSDPAAPVFSFRIPAGKNGKDALGDMTAAVYDINGVGTDIFEYANALFSDCVKKEGGALTGTLSVAEGDPEERAVRNISISSVLPESGAEGDIFILLGREVSKTLGESNEGDRVIIKENGEDTVYLVAGINYHEENSVTLIRKDLHSSRCCYNKTSRYDYPMSEIDIFLETIFTKLYPDSIENILIPTENSRITKRRCFLLTKSDYNSMNYFSDIQKRAATRDKTGVTDIHITATTTSAGIVQAINEAGQFITVNINSNEYFRPAIVLPSDLKVENTEFDSMPAVMPSTSCSGIYVFSGGEWRECASL